MEVGPLVNLALGQVERVQFILDCALISAAFVGLVKYHAPTSPDIAVRLRARYSRGEALDRRRRA